MHGAASQKLKLPMHYAATIGASFEVTELLLDANLEAAAAVDEARSSASKALCRPHCAAAVDPCTFLLPCVL